MKKVWYLCTVISLILLIGVQAYSNVVPIVNDVPQIYYKNSMINAYYSADWEKLEQLANDAIKHYPDCETAYFYKGIALDELGDYKKAIEVYTYLTTQVTAQNKLADLYQNRGLAYFHDKQYDKAIADYDETLKLNSDNKLAKEQREIAIQRKSGIIVEVTNNGKVVNYRYFKDPIYLGQEYQYAPPRKKQEIQNKVINFDPDVLPVYYIAVADEILTKDKDLAALLYGIGGYRSMQDIFVCKDPSAEGAVQMEKLLAPKTVKYVSKKGVKYWAQISQKVLEWDLKNPDRPSPEWICYHGMEVFTNNGKITTDKQQFEAKKSEVRAYLEKFVQETLGK